MDKTVIDKSSPTRVTLRPPSTAGPWRALWEWLLAPTDLEKEESVEVQGRNPSSSDSKGSPKEDKGD